MNTITEEKMIAIRSEDGQLIAVIENDITRRAQITHMVNEVGSDDMKSLLENILNHDSGPTKLFNKVNKKNEISN